MLVYVRPSNEALLRARVPGAQDQRECPSFPILFVTAFRNTSIIRSLWPL
jgi:hypothetical protein